MDPGALVSFGGTHVGGLLVVVYVVHVSCEAEVGDFHHVVVRHQNISGRQVSVDALREEAGRRQGQDRQQDQLECPESGSV